MSGGRGQGASNEPGPDREDKLCLPFETGDREFNYLHILIPSEKGNP